ncbi:hypothetical protein HBA55_19095 [Pseudomaricurvus alkylphenolicus]|uniref:Imm26 family immunity protein n=1 Tax=Pseudomaricurvus alkylphenolicus TaxID=1306991 RepID=UPI00141E0987|nr:Imm26 family immunity protein [Pseudomaricurvus alkylphenolicus]NIB41720.1 hypothetical protein [Pseudomaricurvus alkylphenolicus]
MNIAYPFIPKSTSRIEQGQFWAVPLDNGYGCGVVLAKLSNQGKIDTRLFLAGLLDWSGTDEPTLSSIENAVVIERGFAHIKSITETGGKIIDSGYVVCNFSKEVEDTDSISTWGYHFISKLAAKNAEATK